MRIYRTPNNSVVVRIMEAEGVTDDDLGATIATSPAVRELMELDDFIGIVPLGAPSRNEADGITHCTIIAFEEPPIMWFQKYWDIWEWALEG